MAGITGATGAVAGAYIADITDGEDRARHFGLMSDLEGGPGTQLLFPLVRVNCALGVIMVIAVSCVKLLSAHNSTQHTSRKHKV